MQRIVVKKDFTRIAEIVDRYDLFEDWPWPLIYQDLDHMFPGSKFILTTRKSEHVWLESLKKHSMRRHPINNSRKMAYGYSYPQGHEEEHFEIYRKHNSEVRSYFEGREDDFIELCWENGDGWENLCDFLGEQVPASDFPHVNQGAKKRKKRLHYYANRLYSMLKKYGKTK